jgi:cupin fold WbuC family metalloprotein
MTLDGLEAKSGEVLVCTDEIIALRHSHVERLGAMAAASPKHRARICVHKDADAGIQEMIILMSRSSYLCPHRHSNKCESFHLVEGIADIVVFGDDDEIEKVIPFSPEDAFFYRLDTKRYHTIVVRSDFIVFHEVTNGPFIQNATEYAPFAPREGTNGVENYRKKLDNQIAAWLGKR